ncbi:MAG TPA: class I SAM-dependent methyltransferase family protein [Candidatus Dormibacteraeota bacterium]|nr:class I SAM-dependent methyltransferase family protein [Candidatus Dormibacteraeota bacterium]
MGKLDGSVVGQDEFEPRIRVSRDLEQALAGRIPGDYLAELPRSYDVIGDIAVLEFGARLVGFEDRVAGAILEIHRNVKAVFAQTGPISGSERIRPLRHIAGENRTETVHREFGCAFRVDLSGAFFSPRLSTEHNRVARQVAEGERVVDMFSGVGPFSILIAKYVNEIAVDAIDSNPAATRLLEENARANKVGSKVRVHLGDAREVVNRLPHIATRVIMNHPSAARDFVDSACDALSTRGGVVHYYSFASGDTPEVEARKELETALKSSNHSIHRLLGVRKVREVAPVKWQIAIDAEVTPEPPPKS